MHSYFCKISTLHLLAPHLCIIFNVPNEVLFSSKIAKLLMTGSALEHFCFLADSNQHLTVNTIATTDVCNNSIQHLLVPDQASHTIQKVG